MRLLILADVHANVPALKAVLDYTSRWHFDTILSLGDQLNYGPMPGETLALLKDAGARLLLGNHEARLLKLRAGDKDLIESYNWSMLRWTDQHIVTERLDYDREAIYGDTLMTHAVPGDLNRLIRSQDTGDMDGILKALRQKRLVCGHNHAPWKHTWQGKEFYCVGSLGMLEDNIGSRAAFALMEDDRIELFSIPYDPGPLKAAFVQSGLAHAAPEFARVVHQTMLTGAQELTLRFMDAVRDAAFKRSIPWQGREAFHIAAESFPWTENVSCEDFWRRP